MNKNIFEDISIGQREEMTKTISDSDVVLFAQITGDINPVHLDGSYAQKSIFKRRVVHGMLTASLISAVLGTKLPGHGSVYLGQRLNFKKPVFIGDTVTTIVEVLEKNETKRLLKLLTLCKNQNGDVVIDGEAMIYLPSDQG